jgi:hypothetical protein
MRCTVSRESSRFSPRSAPVAEVSCAFWRCLPFRLLVGVSVRLRGIFLSRLASPSSAVAPAARRRRLLLLGCGSVGGWSRRRARGPDPSAVERTTARLHRWPAHATEIRRAQQRAPCRRFDPALAAISQQADSQRRGQSSAMGPSRADHRFMRDTRSR